MRLSKSKVGPLRLTSAHHTNAIRRIEFPDRLDILSEKRLSPEASG